MGLEKTCQIMIVLKLLGHMDYGWTNKDWMFPGLFVYKFVYGLFVYKLPQLKVASTPSTEQYFRDEHMWESWVIWKSVA